MTSPADVLPALLRADPATPRLTTYDDRPGPTRGERIELSARVLDNWVSKAANALQEEWDVAPGSRVLLALPPHWRTACWALAVWAVGGTVVLGEPATTVDVVVSDDPATWEDLDAPGALVTLAGLARSAPGPTPSPDVLDEARELSTYADSFDAWETPDPTDAALARGEQSVAYGELVTLARTALTELSEPTTLSDEATRAHRVHVRAQVPAGAGDGTQVQGWLLGLLAAFDLGGSVVLSLVEAGATPDHAPDLAHREEVEHVDTRVHL